jgi:catalase
MTYNPYTSNNINIENRPTLTTSTGSPVDDNLNSLTAGPDGPILLQDFHLIDKLAHFDRERIPERVVHAKGAGAHGVFEVTDDVTKYCKAKFLDTIGKKTPVFIRFSTVGGEKGSADTERDPRGFAVKFYTEEGVWDMVGNNTPVFFIRDPSKFPDFIHTQKRNPQTNLKCPDMFWDFLSLTPESCHQVTILFSDRGTPDGYRHMHGYSSHTLKFVNKNGEVYFVKIHIRTEDGIKNLPAGEADKLKSEDPDYATRDLFNHIASGKTADWTFYFQAMPEKDAENYAWNILDITKVWSHKDYPLIKVGTIKLNRNPDNYFAETEQSAFSPSHMVPGIEPSLDKMLQGRLFSYPDTHRHRLGANYLQLPINCPYSTKVANHQRDGPATFNNQGSALNYEPNSFSGPVPQPKYTQHQFKVAGHAVRMKTQHRNDDFFQPGVLYSKVMNDQHRTNLVNNLTGNLKNAKLFLQERQTKIFHRVHPEYGMRIGKALGLNINYAAKF